MDRILGLAFGADDCISIPFDPREVVIRMKAILRRVSKDKDGENYEKQRVVSAGRLSLDMVQGEIIRGNDEIKISGMESEILRVRMKTLISY